MSKIDELFDHYLIESFRYYVVGDNEKWSDPEYDSICILLYDAWDEITHHDKGRASRDTLKCGSGFDIEWPQWVREAYDPTYQRGEDE